MEKLHSNVYQLNENWLLGKIYNRLGILDGHFTLIFKKDNTEFKIYKHGGYSNTNPLNNYEQIEFNGFIDLSLLPIDTVNNLKEILNNSIESLQYYNDNKPKKCGSIWVFDCHETHKDFLKFLS